MCGFRSKSAHIFKDAEEIRHAAGDGPIAGLGDGPGLVDLGSQHPDIGDLGFAHEVVGPGDGFCELGFI